MSDAELIRSPGAWARWPVLPVKRMSDEKPASDQDLGVIVESAGEKVTVYEINMYELPVPLSRRALNELPHTVYDDAEAAIEDGWVVD